MPRQEAVRILRGYSRPRDSLTGSEMKSTWFCISVPTPPDKDTATEHCSVSLIANDRLVPSWENWPRKG
jgi:hypothetical protein